MSLPDGLWVTAFPMQVDLTGIITQRSRFTDEIMRLVVAPGRWQGSISLAVQDEWSRTHDDVNDSARADIAARANAFVSAFASGQTATLPMRGPTIAAAAVAPTVDTITAAGILNLSAEIEIADADFVRIGDRIYQARDPALGTGAMTDALTVEPHGIHLRRSTVVGQTVVPADVIQAETVDYRTIASPRDPEFWGPWTFNWREVQ